MKDCLFCKIVRGEIPSQKVYEDDDVFAFLDISLATRGHTLIIPKEHYENIFDISEETLAKIAKTAKKLALDFEDKLGADGYNLVHSSKSAAQQEVDHFHLHLVPRYVGDKIDLWKSKKEHPFKDDLDETQKILSL